MTACNYLISQVAGWSTRLLRLSWLIVVSVIANLLNIRPLVSPAIVHISQEAFSTQRRYRQSSANARLRLLHLTVTVADGDEKFI